MVWPFTNVRDNAKGLVNDSKGYSYEELDNAGMYSDVAKDSAILDGIEWDINKDKVGMGVGVIKEGVNAWLTWEMIDLQREYKKIKNNEVEYAKELGEKALTLQGEQNERMADLKETEIKYAANIENHRIDKTADVQKEKIKSDALLALFTGREQYSFGQPTIY